MMLHMWMILSSFTTRRRGWWRRSASQPGPTPSGTPWTALSFYWFGTHKSIKTQQYERHYIWKGTSINKQPNLFVYTESSYKITLPPIMDTVNCCIFMKPVSQASLVCVVVKLSFLVLPLYLTMTMHLILSLKYLNSKNWCLNNRI